MDNFFRNFNFASIDLNWIWKLIFIAIFVYIIGYSFLQVRELKVLQGKVKTPIDKFLTILSYIYLLVQILIFVVVLLIL